MDDSFENVDGSPMREMALEDHSGIKMKGVVGGKYTLTEQMLNKKEFEKYKGDIKKIKAIMTDMQKYVTEH